MSKGYVTEMNKFQADKTLQYTEAHGSPSTTPSSEKPARKVSRARSSRHANLGSQTPSSNAGGIMEIL